MRLYLTIEHMLPADRETVHGPSTERQPRVAATLGQKNGEKLTDRKRAIKAAKEAQ